MNKDEYTELFDKNGVEAWEQAEKLPADEMVSLLDGFEQAPDEEKTQSAKLAYEVLKNSMMTRINDMRGKLDSLSLAELDALEVLIGKAESLGGMSYIGLKASIKDHRAVLEASDTQNVDAGQPQQTNADVKADEDRKSVV